tara:strand:- start:24 stop:542 length:519 start_codon:yes stop_codon:yes gene_type:complete
MDELHKQVIIKYISVISAALFGGLLIVLLIYKLNGLSGSSASKSYTKSLSLDKLYDEAKGNDPLSEARMTSKINISSEDYSCGFLATYQGVRDRTILCETGCQTTDEDNLEETRLRTSLAEGNKTDELNQETTNSLFCKQFEYPGTGEGIGPLSNTLLDETYVKRKRATSNE